MNQQIEVPTDAVLDVVTAQRNEALNDNARLQVLAQQLMADNEQLRGEVDKLRADVS